MAASYLDISSVGIEFDTNGQKFRALRDVSLKMEKGEFVSLIGHSGCGKSTVLNIVAGLYRSTEGGVILEGEEVTEPGPDRAVVFQHHSLMPWLSVYDNVALAVDQVFRKTMSRKERREWILHNLELVNMDHALDKLPGEISGGMKQRVGIARCLSMQPKVLLMDEPFGALDALTRAQLQDSLMEIQADLGNTVIMITHDVDEAVLLSDRIVMMTNGPAATIGKVLDITLDRPRDRLELAEDSDFVHMRQQVLEFLYARHDDEDDALTSAAAEGEAESDRTASLVSLEAKRKSSGTEAA
ncbi:MAG: ABC transporter ATP-binding protein [Pseudomonadota bacterium]